jgi:hypothetical protein
MRSASQAVDTVMVGTLNLELRQVFCMASCTVHCVSARSRFSCCMFSGPSQLVVTRPLLGVAGGILLTVPHSRGPCFNAYGVCTFGGCYWLGCRAVDTVPLPFGGLPCKRLVSCQASLLEGRLVASSLRELGFY